MYMRKPNPIADNITKHVLAYLLENFNLKAGDINNIRMIITRCLNKNIKQQHIVPEIKKKNSKAP